MEYYFSFKAKIVKIKNQISRSSSLDLMVNSSTLFKSNLKSICLFIKE